MNAEKLSYQDMSDEALCLATAQGDALAEEHLILRYRRTVLISSRSFFLLGGENEDLVQEGMVGLLKAIRSYDSHRGASFRTYADRCVNHALITAVQSAARDKHTPLNTSVSLENPLFDDSADYLPGQALDPERQMILQEEVHECLGAIHSQLSSFETKVLGLYLKVLSYSEIALQVNRPVKSVDNAVQRVRRKLSHKLSHSDSSKS
jgi:RNA polymerase sporulation-specific sigma factor